MRRIIFAVYELKDLGKFPGSDHNALTWKLLEKCVYESTERSFYDYSKADFESIRRELQSINWNELFSGSSVELGCLLFKDYQELL